MAKMWAGRFSKEVDETVNAFNSSISFDERMFEEDINGSIAHAKMLLKQNIIEKSDEEKIVSADVVSFQKMTVRRFRLVLRKSFQISNQVLLNSI